jgi:Mrp family chromosome partitioning ATPase
VTSASVGDGKSTTSLCLAIAMVEREDSVLIVEADLRRKGISAHLDLSDHPGVADALAGRGELAAFRTYVSRNGGLEAVRQAPARTSTAIADPMAEGTMAVVPAGEAPREAVHRLMTADRLRRLLYEATTLADRVVVDGAPLGATAEMLPVAAQVDGIVVVVRLYHTRRDELERLAAQLAAAELRPAGLVVYDPRHGR